MFENVKYRIESPCKICNERKEACWDRCEKYKRYKQETQKQKDFLNGKINYIAEARKCATGAMLCSENGEGK